MLGVVRHILLIVAVFLPLLMDGSPAVTPGGLRFTAAPENTSLDLFSGKRKPFVGETAIGFDMKIFNSESFGQILALDIPDNPFILTLVSIPGKGPTLVLSSQNDRGHFVEIPYAEIVSDISEWEHVELSICPDDGRLQLSLCGKSWALDDTRLFRKFRMNILFGGNGGASVVESPEIAIRQIVIANGKKTLTFPLDEAKGNVVRQSNGGLKGKVLSPRWLVYDHHFWQKECEFNADKAAGIAYDETRDRIVVVNSDTLQVLDFSGGRCSITGHPVFPRHLPSGYSGEAVYDAGRDVIYFYNLIDREGIAWPFFAQLGMDGHLDYALPTGFNNPLHHHACVFFPDDRGLYIFGGYGNYSYSDRIYRFDFDSFSWENVDYAGDVVSPRMHTVAGRLSDSEMLIFGGVGNETGRQELGKDFFYDLYLFNTDSLSLKKLWEVEEEGRYVPTRNIVADPENGCIYVFCRDRGSNAFLKRFDMETGRSETVSDGLFYPTDDIVSSYYLFARKGLDRFYLVNRHSDGDRSRVSVFRLNAPPVPMSYIEKAEDDGHRSYAFQIAVMAAIVLLAFIACACLIFTRRKMVQTADDSQEEQRQTAPERSNAIYFFGEFTVIDRDGNDISDKFGPKLKQLLACMMIFSENYGGINSMRLSSSIWPEKTMTEAKGTRGVSINHLRSILKNLDGIDIVFENDKWKVVMSSSLYWDYADAMRLSADIIAGGFDLPLCHAFISLLERGPLLPAFVQYQWFDSIKVDIEDNYFNVAEKMLPYLYDCKEYRLAVKCADILFAMDRFNETALKYKVSSLKRMGKPELARQVEHRFHEEMEILEK